MLKGMGEGAWASTQCQVLFLLCLPIGMIVGAASATDSGTSRTTTDSVWVAYHEHLAREIQDFAIAERIRDAINHYSVRTSLNATLLPLSAGPSSKGSTPEYGADSDLLLEISATRVSIDSRDGRTALLSLAALVRRVSTRDNKTVERFEIASTVEGDLKDFIFSAGAPKALAIVIDGIVEAVVDEELLIYRGNKIATTQTGPTSGGAVTPRKHIVPGYALSTLFPPSEKKVPIPNLQPTFEWEPVPRHFDIPVGENGGEAHNLRYDFRLYLEDTPNIVYERSVLEVPTHQVEEPLLRCATYRWTVRATFELNGRPRVTEWSTGDESRGKRRTLSPPDRRKFAVFRTPCE